MWDSLDYIWEYVEISIDLENDLIKQCICIDLPIGF